MTIPLDIIHVSANGTVVRLLKGIKPWRIGPLVLQSKWVVELPVGAIGSSQTEIGDILKVIED